jgi:hypothetical protein
VEAVLQHVPFCCPHEDSAFGGCYFADTQGECVVEKIIADCVYMQGFSQKQLDELLAAYHAA